MTSPSPAATGSALAAAAPRWGSLAVSLESIRAEYSRTVSPLDQCLDWGVPFAALVAGAHLLRRNPGLSLADQDGQPLSDAGLALLAANVFVAGLTVLAPPEPGEAGADLSMPAVFGYHAVADGISAAGLREVVDRWGGHEWGWLGEAAGLSPAELPDALRERDALLALAGLRGHHWVETLMGDFPAAAPA